MSWVSQILNEGGPHPDGLSPIEKEWLICDGCEQELTEEDARWAEINIQILRTSDELFIPKESEHCCHECFERIVKEDLETEEEGARLWALWRKKYPK